MSWRCGRRLPVVEIRRIKAMAMTSGDIVRHLPLLLPGDACSIDAGSIVYQEPYRMLRINLCAASERVLVALRLRLLRVEFVFEGYAEQDVDEFMRRFEEVYRRGG